MSLILPGEPHVSNAIKGQDIKPDNLLYWTNQGQNWNGMCADCHTTNLKKNYNIQTRSFHTTWSEIDVSCEVCHGPASEHIRWAALPESSRSKSKIYARQLNEKYPDNPAGEKLLKAVEITTN